MTEISVIRPVAPIECRRGDSETARQRSVPCFLAGDLRANEHVSKQKVLIEWLSLLSFFFFFKN